MNMRSLSRHLVHCSVVAEPIQPGSPVAVGAASHIVHAAEFAVISVEAKTFRRVVVFDAGVILQEALVEAGVVVFLHPHLCELGSAQREDGGPNAVADGALEVVVADLGVVVPSNSWMQCASGSHSGEPSSKGSVGRRGRARGRGFDGPPKTVVRRVASETNTESKVQATMTRIELVALLKTWKKQLSDMLRRKS